MAQIKGIDVSVFQPNIDWVKVKNDGIEFAIIKATQGKDSKYPNGFIDSCFDKHYAGAKAAGIKIGAYHFAVFTTEAQAKEEAQYFMSALKGKTFEYPLCLDLEDLAPGRSPILSQKLTGKQLTDYSIIFMEELKKNGYRPMLYTNTNWRKNILDYSRLSNYLLWQAHYPISGESDMKKLLNYRPAAVDSKVDIWQCSGWGKVAGIPVNVDVNWGFGDLYNNTSAPQTPLEKTTNETEGKLMSKEYDDLKKSIDDLKNNVIKWTNNSKIKYGWVDGNMPEYARATITKLSQKGILKGDENGNLQLSDDMLRLFVTLDRAGIYGG